MNNQRKLYTLRFMQRGVMDGPPRKRFMRALTTDDLMAAYRCLKNAPGHEFIYRGVIYDLDDNPILMYEDGIEGVYSRAGWHAYRHIALPKPWVWLVDDAD